MTFLEFQCPCGNKHSGWRPEPAGFTVVKCDCGRYLVPPAESGGKPTEIGAYTGVLDTTDVGMEESLKSRRAGERPAATESFPRNPERPRESATPATDLTAPAGSGWRFSSVAAAVLFTLAGFCVWLAPTPSLPGSAGSRLSLRLAAGPALFRM